MRVRALLLVAGSLGLALAASACSVVGDGKVDRVDPPFGLADTLATSTTIASTTTIQQTTTTGLDTSTTGVPTEAVRLYFITGQQLNFVPTPLPADPSLPQIMAALLAGPPKNELGVGLRTGLPEDALIDASSNNAGVAIVELPEGFFDDIPEGDQRLATAQIVLTLTDSRGIGQVQFNQQVPKPSGALTPAGQPLSRNDFASLLEGATPPTSTTAAPTSTTSG